MKIFDRQELINVLPIIIVIFSINELKRKKFRKLLKTITKKFHYY